MHTWINKRLQELGKTKADLARHLGIPFARVSEMINGNRKLQQSEYSKFASFMGVSIEDSLSQFEKPHSPLPAIKQNKNNISKSLVPKDDNFINYELVKEYDLTVSAGSGAFVDSENLKGQWPFNPEYIAGYLSLQNPNLAIVQVNGDSMEPTLTSGDKVMVNLNDTQISQPGIFIVHDGYGTVIKRVERILNGEGGVRLISDNERHTAYEVAGDAVNIVGRVVWAAKRL